MGADRWRGNIGITKEFQPIFVRLDAFWEPAKGARTLEFCRFQTMLIRLEASRKPAGNAGTLISLRIPTNFRKSNRVLEADLGADRRHGNIGKTNEFYSCFVRLDTFLKLPRAQED